MQYETGKIYEIVTPTYGALFFKYQNGSFSSVDRNGNSLNVRIFKVDDAGTLLAPDSSNPFTLSLADLQVRNYCIGAVDDWEIWKSFTNPTLGEGILLNVDPVSDGYSSETMEALLEDAAAMTFYTCVQAMMPYLVTMANATKCLSSSQISFEMVSMRHSQSVLQKQVAMEKMIEEIRNSKLMKFLSSPWFTLILVLAAVIIAILSIVTAGTALAVILPVVLAVVVAVALIITVSVFYAQDKENMDKLKKDLGYANGVIMPKELQEMWDKAQDALLAAFLISLALIIISCASMGYGGANISTAIGNAEIQLAKAFTEKVVTETIKMAAKLSVVVGMASGVAIAATSVASGVYAIAEGLIMKGTAAMEYAISKVRTQSEGLTAMSKLFKDLMSRMEESLKMLMDTLQELIKRQSEIIKTLGEGSHAITRNIAGI
jgi:hypothetical protein